VAIAQELSISKVRSPSAALVAVATIVALTVPLAYLLNIWQDEAYTLHTTAGGFAYAFHQALGFEQNAPLYFLLLTAWRHLGDSAFFLRLPSVFCIAGALALVPGLVRRYVPSADSGLVTWVAAWNPFTVWAAVEMRVYALIVLLSAVLLLTFFDAFLAEQRSRLSTLAYAAFCIVALYTQYYFAFLLFAQGVAVVVYRRQSVWRFLICAAVAVAAFTPMLAIVPNQVANFKGAFTPPSPLRANAVLAAILARFLLPLFIAHAKAIYLALAVCALGVAIAVRKQFAKGGDGTILVLTGCAFIAFAFGTYALGVHLLDRHAAALYLPAQLAVFAVFSFLSPPLRRAATTAWAALALTASTVFLAHAYAPLAKQGDWVRVASYLHEHEGPGQPIAVFEAENALPFSYYYHGANRVVAVPAAVDFRRYDVTRFVLHSAGDVARSLPEGSRFWLITAGECASANIRFGCDVLERFIGLHYRVERDAKFYGSRVRLLRPLDKAGGRLYGSTVPLQFMVFQAGVASLNEVG